MRDKDRATEIPSLNSIRTETVNLYEQVNEGESAPVETGTDTNLPPFSIEHVNLPADVERRVALVTVKIGNVRICGVGIWRIRHGRLVVRFPSYNSGLCWDEAVELTPELRAEIEAAVIAAYKAEKEKREPRSAVEFHLPPEGIRLWDEVEAYQRRWLEAALAQTHGSESEAAKLLGLTKRQMRYLCLRHDLRRRVRKEAKKDNQEESNSEGHP